jgi:hypothetical protein
MDSLPLFALWIIAVALGLSPAFLAVGVISRSLHLTPWPRSKSAFDLGRSGCGAN